MTKKKHFHSGGFMALPKSRSHRNPLLMFPSRQKGLAGASGATTHMDRGGVQQVLRQVTGQIGLKKELRRIACATATQPI